MTNTLRREWLGRITYADALARQEALVESKILDPQSTPDTLLLLEHEPVYTIGRTPDRSSLGATAAALPHPLETINRGGQATYHGPGQLVGYPILDLGRRGKDLHVYLRFLEETLISALATHGVTGVRREGLTGVWVGERKIASIGVGVRRWVSLHGFAINVVGGAALSPFDAITPCGLAGVQMTALESEAGQTVGVETFARTVGEIFAERLESTPLLNGSPVVQSGTPDSS